MHPIQYLVPARRDNFDESAYLEANPDIVQAITDGRIPNGRVHFFAIGYAENRSLAFRREVLGAKSLKIHRIREEGLLASGITLGTHNSGALDYLPADIAAAAGVVHTDAVSSNDYDPRVQSIIDTRTDCWILDAGSGLRKVYFPKVVNYEVVPYPTTDVLGLVERMPFADDVFDFVLSNAVLEHVRDPFSAAKEMIRVLRPGGMLYCAVPFLQPYHGYPHHYFNMTRQGLQRLFDVRLQIVQHDVPFYFHPVWAVSWILNAWGDGLSSGTREFFRELRIADIMDFSVEQMGSPFVAELDEAKQFELASGTFLIARKPSISV